MSFLVVLECSKDKVMKLKNIKTYMNNIYLI